jgi:hypothetical protein
VYKLRDSQRRRAAELERTTATGEPDRRSMENLSETASVVQQIAGYAFGDAIDIMQIIDSLEAANEPAVVSASDAATRLGKPLVAWDAGWVVPTCLCDGTLTVLGDLDALSEQTFATKSANTGH